MLSNLASPLHNVVVTAERRQRRRQDGLSSRPYLPCQQPRRGQSSFKRTPEVQPEKKESSPPSNMTNTFTLFEENTNKSYFSTLRAKRAMITSTVILESILESSFLLIQKDSKRSKMIQNV